MVVEANPGKVRGHIAAKVIIAVILYLVGNGISSTYIEPFVRPIAFRLLASMRGPVNAKSRLKVVDITKFVESDRGAPVPAWALKQIAVELASLPNPPRVVAFDIDMSAQSLPELGDDIRFLNKEYSEALSALAVLQAQSKHPVAYFVGVGSNVIDPARVFIPNAANDQESLKSRAYSAMATSIRVFADPTMMPLYFQSSESAVVLPSMGYAVAQQLKPDLQLHTSTRGYLQEVLGESKDKHESLDCAKYPVLVDYRVLTNWKKMVFEADLLGKGDHIKAFSDDAINSIRDAVADLGGKGTDTAGYAVFVGRADPGSIEDAFVVEADKKGPPAINADVYPRLVQHVALASTLLEGRITELAEFPSKTIECALVCLSVLLCSLQIYGKVRNENERKNFLGCLLVACCFLGAIVIALPTGVLVGGLMKSKANCPMPICVLVGGAVVLLMAVVLSFGHIEELLANSSGQPGRELPEVHIRFFIIGLCLSVALGFAAIGVLWLGFLSVVLFSLLDGYLDPFLERAAKALIRINSDKGNVEVQNS